LGPDLSRHQEDEAADGESESGVVHGVEKPVHQSRSCSLHRLLEGSLHEDTDDSRKCGPDDKRPPLKFATDSQHGRSEPHGE